MDIFAQINNIPITQILDRIGIKYKKIMWTLSLYENWKLTDWRKCNINEWFITDFTWKRSQWDRITFIMWYLNLDKWEVVEWYKQQFNLIDSSDNSNINKKNKLENIKQKFNSLWELNNNQIEFLKNRWIDYEKVKDVVKNNNWFACLIYNENWRPITINTRWLEKKEFRIIAWTESKWVYMWNIDINIKKIYVVEWMFDFLSLRQFIKNVIWLKSAVDWFNVVLAFYQKWYEIIYIPDNDEPWKKSLNFLKNIEYFLFDLSKYQIKDINDFLIDTWYWEWIFEIIEQEKIFISNKKQDEIYNKIKPYTWWTIKLDSKISPIEKNHFIIFWWKQWQWKTTFTFDMACKNCLLGHNILYISLEMDCEKIKTNIARAYAWIWKEEWRLKSINEMKVKLYLKRKDEINSIENLKLFWFWTWEIPILSKIIDIIIQENPDLVFIDNFDLIQIEEKLSSLEKSELISKSFLKFTNDYQIPCIILHHIKKWWSWVDWLRWSWKISDDADLIIFGSRTEWLDDEVSLKTFTLTEYKSRDWWTYEIQDVYFNNWSFTDTLDWIEDFKN